MQVHKAMDLKVLYFGTPVVLVSSRNADGSPNLAPISSAWWLGRSCLIGLSDAAQTSANLKREAQCVLNLVPSTLVETVDRPAMTTGAADVPGYKAAMGYRYEPRKFEAAGLSPQPSELVAPPRVAQCPVQLECRVVGAHPIVDDRVSATAFQLTVVQAHVAEELVIPGTHYVDPVAWDPLIMKFCEFFGDAHCLHSSRLATGWRMPHGARA